MNVNNQEGFPHDNDCCRKQDNRSGQITTSQPCSSPARLWCDDIKKHPNRFFILWGGSYHSVRSSSDIRLSQGNITSNKNNNNNKRERPLSVFDIPRNTESSRAWWPSSNGCVGSFSWLSVPLSTSMSRYFTTRSLPVSFGLRQRAPTKSKAPGTSMVILLTLISVRHPHWNYLHFCK